MALEQGLLNYGLPVGADLRARQFCGVVLDSTGKLALATAGRNMIGVLQDKPNVGEAGAVALFGVSKALAGGTGFSTGDLLEVTTNGAFQTANTGTVVAQAVLGAAAGNWGLAIIFKSVAAF